MGAENKPKTIVLTANSMQNLAHFRSPLFDALSDAGYDLVALAPDDGGSISVPHRRVNISLDRGGVNPFADWRTIRAYRSAFLDSAPAAVLGFTPKANIYGALAARGAGAAFIPTVSGLGSAFLKGGLLRSMQSALYRKAFARCPRVVFQNPDDRDHFLAERLVRPDQVLLIPGSGIDVFHFTVAPRPASQPTAFLFVGRLLADKGVRELAGAARRLRATGVPFQLSLLGEVDDGNPTSVTAAEVRGWQDEGLLQWVGGQADVRPFIADADAVVLPSYREGLPRALLEASAMGRAMVATDVPGCRELVRGGDTGFLCAPRDEQALADAMRRMIALPADERSAMGQRARHLVEKRFDAAIVVRRYLDLLASLGL